MRLPRLFIAPTAILVFVACSFWTTSAFAQYFANNDRGGLIVSTTTTTTALVGGAIMLTVVAATGDDKMTMLRNYLRHNETAVRGALAMGGGDTLRDLAAFFGVRDEDRFRAFARLARRHRETWMRLAYEEDDVDALQRVVRTAMQFDPRLRG